MRALAVHRRQAGFTLLEILVALGIFVVAVSSIVSLLLVAASSHKRAVDRTRAALLAEAVFADLEGQRRVGQPLQPITAGKHPDFPGMFYDLELEFSQQVNTVARAKLTVRWQREGKRRTHLFETMLLSAADPIE